MTTRYPPKDPGENVLLVFDFKKAGTEEAPAAPTSPDVQVAVRKGVDATPEAIKVGAAIVDGTRVLQRVSGGLDDVDYTVNCYANVGADRLLIDTILPVRARPAP